MDYDAIDDDDLADDDDLLDDDFPEPERGKVNVVDYDALDDDDLVDLVNQAPDIETVMAWIDEDGGCEATDGCWVEVDGRCPHGKPSWAVWLGLV